MTQECTLSTESLLKRGKKAFKEKELTPSIGFNTCTTTVEKYIERYDKHPSQVPQYLLGCVSKLENFVRLFYLLPPYEVRMAEEVSILSSLPKGRLEYFGRSLMLVYVFLWT